MRLFHKYIIKDNMQIKESWIQIVSQFKERVQNFVSNELICFNDIHGFQKLTSRNKLATLIAALWVKKYFNEDSEGVDIRLDFYEDNNIAEISIDAQRFGWIVEPEEILFYENDTWYYDGKTLPSDEMFRYILDKYEQKVIDALNEYFP